MNMRKLTIEERGFTTEVFAELDEPTPVKGMEPRKVCIATFNKREDAEMFVAVATATPKYRVEALSNDGTWFDTHANVETTNRAIIDRAFAEEVENSRVNRLGLKLRIAVARTISVEAPAKEEA